MAGANSWQEVERFGWVRLPWLQQFLELPNGIPSHDTFRRVFARIDPKAFNRCVAAWMRGLGEAIGLRHVAIDGKANRSAKADSFCGCLFLVNAWAVENRLILAQAAVAQGTNEIGTIPDLLQVLDLKDALVTLDAAGCQKAFAETIRQKEGDYLLCVKGNQEGLEAAVHEVFDRAGEADYLGVEHDGHEEISPRREHGRHEERYTTVIYDPKGLPPGWPDVAAVILVGREREVAGKRTVTSHYYTTSHRGTAEGLGRLIRRHWGIENQLHWSLDVTFGEDRNRTAKDHAGTNLSLIRKVALSLLKQDPRKGSLRSKRLNAGWDGAYMLKALRGFAQI